MKPNQCVEVNVDMLFEAAVALIIDLEGGISDHPDDPGGLTKYGITIEQYPELGKDGIRTLTIEKAKELYKRDYWDKIRGDDVAKIAPNLAVCYFDCAVNQGYPTAIRLLQQALGVGMDGKFGPVTMNSLKVKGDSVLDMFMSYRMLRYVRTNNFSTFGKGWFKRVSNVCRNSELIKSQIVYSKGE